MLISVYTRHSESCPKKDEPYWKRCTCRKWLYCADWKPTRQSAKTRSWTKAEERARELSERAPDTHPSQEVMIRQAVKLYIENKAQKNVSKNYREKLDRELYDFADWCLRKPILTMKELRLFHLEEYRKTWTQNSTTRYKRQERLSGFFKYCARHEWIRRNISGDLDRINIDAAPVIPFTKDEYARILAACDTYNPDGIDRDYRRQRARVMVKLLRWSGLRLGDAARLERFRLDSEDRILLRMEKTREPVFAPIPPDVAEELRALKNSNDRYFFWSGKTNKNTPVVRWWETLKAVFRVAGIPDAHPHQFRHTFAVELLLSGVDIKTVSMLLGHRRVATTEKHYSAWVKERQDRLSEAVRRSWSSSL